MANIFQQAWNKVQKEINEAVDNGREFVKDVADGTFLDNVKDKCEDITNTISGKINNATDFDRNGKSDVVESAEWIGKKANNVTDFNKDGKSDVVQSAELVTNKIKNLKNYIHDNLDVDNDGKLNAVRDIGAFIKNTRESIENGHKQFLDTFDKNNNGWVGVGELKDYFQEKLSEAKENLGKLKEMMQLMNGSDGATVEINTDPKTKEEMQKYFLENADINNDGKIKTDEIMKFLQEETKYEEGKANEILDKIDYNRDGKLTINEDLKTMLTDAGVQFSIMEAYSYAKSPEGSKALSEIMDNIQKIEKEAAETKEERLDSGDKKSSHEKKLEDFEERKENEKENGFFDKFKNMFDLDKDDNGKIDIAENFGKLFDRDKDGVNDVKEMIDNVTDKFKGMFDKDNDKDFSDVAKDVAKGVSDVAKDVAETTKEVANKIKEDEADLDM